MGWWSSIGEFVNTASEYASDFADIAGNVDTAFSYFDGGNTGSANGGSYWGQWFPSVFPPAPTSEPPKKDKKPPSKSVSTGFVSDAPAIIPRPASSPTVLLLLVVVGVALVVKARK